MSDMRRSAPRLVPLSGNPQREKSTSGLRNGLQRYENRSLTRNGTPVSAPFATVVGPGWITGSGPGSEPWDFSARRCEPRSPHFPHKFCINT